MIELTSRDISVDSYTTSDLFPPPCNLGFESAAYMILTGLLTVAINLKPFDRETLSNK